MKDIEESEQPNTVWTWVDDDDNGFRFDRIVVNNAVAGDTDSIMLSMGDLFPAGADADEVTEVADAIASMTNETFPDFVEHAFNCPKERRQSIQTDREIISDKSIFLSKKRYILHVVNDEGKKVDKLKIMGVELKKSDTPAIVKNMLSRLVDLMLDGGTMQDAHTLIKEMKDEYADAPIREIARPMSVKGLKKYNDEFEMTGKMDGFPYNVRAAMFYNKKCSKSNKPIVAGDKIGIVYIKNPESKYIGFPIEINEFPEFMNELVIDYDTQWDKAYKKLVSYMSALGWDIESRKKKKRESLFGF